MSKKLSSLLPEICQHWETVQVRICSVVQGCFSDASPGEGVMEVEAGEAGFDFGATSGAGLDSELQPAAARTVAARARDAMLRGEMNFRFVMSGRVPFLSEGIH